MSFCSDCGASLDANSKFCSDCGASITVASAVPGKQPADESQRSTRTTSDSFKSDSAAVLMNAGTSAMRGLQSAGEAIQKTHVLQKLSRALLNPAFFVIAYAVFLIPTYILPYVGSNSSVLNTAAAAAGMGLSPAFYCHLAALAILIWISWLRGKLIDKAWLAALPLAAAMFDLLPGLSMIPMVPTVLHVVAIVLGVKDDAKK